MHFVARREFVGKYIGKVLVYPFKIKSVDLIKKKSTGHLLAWTELHTRAPTLHTGQTQAGAHTVITRSKNCAKVLQNFGKHSLVKESYFYLEVTLVFFFCLIALNVG